MEKTLILVKPDGVRRNLTGEIISRFERRGFSIIDLRMLTVDEEMATRHYAEHVEKPFFGELVEFITSGPTVAMVIEGLDVIRVARTMMGATNPADAAPGTIRGDLAKAMPDNVIHGSDSAESATREIGIFFG